MAPGDPVATVIYVCLVLSCVSVALRILVRWKWLEAGLRLDDWVMVLALAIYVILCAVGIVWTVLGNRSAVLTESTANQALLVLAIAESLFMLTSIALKISLVIFFRQFILEHRQRLFLTLATTFYCAMSVLGFGLALFPCGAPIHFARKRINNQCIPTNVFNGLLYTHGATSMVSDWIFALLPIVVLWKSSMPATTKFGITLLMMFAICGSLCAVLRTIYTGSLHFDARYYDPEHQSYYQVTAWMVSMAFMEMGIGITAASVACLMPLFRRCADASRHYFSSRTRRFDLERRKLKDYSSTTRDVTNSDSSAPWGKNVLVRPGISSLESGRMELRTLGVLPTEDPVTGEDICGEYLDDHCYHSNLK